MNDRSSRPAIADHNARAKNFGAIFPGFPIWRRVAPTIHTLLENYDFSGKTIILCAASGGSGFGQAVAGLKDSVTASYVIRAGRILKK